MSLSKLLFAKEKEKERVEKRRKGMHARNNETLRFDFSI